jgi:soluble lytic murein transglycosylase-like protein
MLAMAAIALFAGSKFVMAEVITDGVTFGKPVYSSGYQGQTITYVKPAKVKYVRTYKKSKARKKWSKKSWSKNKYSKKSWSKKARVKKYSSRKSLRKKARTVGRYNRMVKGKSSRKHLRKSARLARKGRKGGRSRAPRGRRGLVSVLKSVKPKGLPLRLAMAVVTVESGWRVHARGSSGERGLMQLMPATARRFGGAGNLYNPRHNMRVGTRYLHWCYRRARGNVAATIGCYNRGPGLMWSWSKNAITRRYVGKVRRYMRRS